MADDRGMARDSQAELAEAEAEVRRLLGILRARAAEVGEHRALADVCALVSGAGQSELAGLLAAALRMLADSTASPAVESVALPARPEP